MWKGQFEQSPQPSITCMVVLTTSVLASISGENLEVKSVLAHVFSAVPLWYTST
jgi:hypothetical protein